AVATRVHLVAETARRGARAARARGRATARSAASAADRHTAGGVVREEPGRAARGAVAIAAGCARADDVGDVVTRVDGEGLSSVRTARAAAAFPDVDADPTASASATTADAMRGQGEHP